MTWSGTTAPVRWRIYGPARGNGSWARVRAGLVEGLTLNGQQVSVFDTDDAGHELDQPMTAGYDADIGIFVGPPAHARMMRGQGQHTHRWVMLAPNSTWLPAPTLDQLEQTGAITGYLTPSEWGATILANYTELPVGIWGHGVSKDFGPPHLGCSLVAQPYRVLHLSSTQLGRKGTVELVRAWCTFAAADDLAVTELDAELEVVVDGPRGGVQDAVVETLQALQLAPGGLLAQSIKASVRVSPRGDWDPEHLAAIYASADLVAQPSRSEGFGMVPLEARACGVPVLMTDGTGHDDHFDHMPTDDFTRVDGVDGVSVATDDGVVVVDTGAYAPIDDGPGAEAPTYGTEQLVGALKLAYANRRLLTRGAARSAESVRNVHSWQTETGWFLDAYFDDGQPVMMIPPQGDDDDDANS